MTEAIVLKAVHLKRLVAILAPFVDDARLVIVDDQIVTKAVDSPHVVMIQAQITLANKVSAGRTVPFDCERVKDWLEAITPGDEDEVEVDWSSAGAMSLVHKGLRCQFPPHDVSGIADTKIPKLKFSAKATIDCDRFLKVCKVGQNYADHIELRATARCVELSLVEEDAGAVGDVGTIIEGEPAKSTFIADYIVHGVAALQTIAKRATVELATDYPVRLSASDETMQAMYLMAPRIEMRG